MHTHQCVSLEMAQAHHAFLQPYDNSIASADITYLEPSKPAISGLTFSNSNTGESLEMMVCGWVGDGRLES